MWFSRALSALGLAACALAAAHDQTTTDENGIRSIPVRLFLTSNIMCMLINDSCEHIPFTRFVNLDRQWPLAFLMLTRDTAIPGLGHAESMV
jgi:hypothetical protein